MNKQLITALVGFAVVSFAIFAFITGTNEQAQGIIDWGNSPEGFTVYQPKYALAGSFWVVGGILGTLIGLPCLIVGLVLGLKKKKN